MDVGDDPLDEHVGPAEDRLNEFFGQAGGNVIEDVD